MWRPSSYEDVERAIGVLKETATLDFKKALSKGQGALDLAKDCAAMAIEGGSIVVGVAEDGAARAASLEPIELAGAPERVQQVVDANVYPRCTSRMRERRSAYRLPDLRHAAGRHSR